jgi:membrane protein YdbS with pleckstrin-like domain
MRPAQGMMAPTPARKTAYSYRRDAPTAIFALNARGFTHFRVPEMRYIERVLQPGESLIHASKIHWIIYIPGVAVVLAGIAVFIVALGHPSQLFWLALFIGCFAIGFFLLFLAWFKRWTTEIDVTDRRIVYKRGFIWRHTVEMNMDKVESVDVEQSLLGRLFGYGDITIRGTGIGLEPLRNIEAPLQFRNTVTAR